MDEGPPETQPEPDTPAPPESSRGPLGIVERENFGGFWFGPLSAYGRRRVPAMAWHNFRRELLAAAFLPFVLVIFEGSVLSVLVRIGFEGKVPGPLLNTVSAFIAIVPALANLSSFVWVRLAHGQHKVEALTRLMATMLAFVLVIGLVPQNTWGLFATALAALAGRVCWSGIVTLRSTIWRQNYPASSRARITGTFAMVMTLLLALLSLGLGGLLNINASALRVVVPVSAALGVVGLWAWRRVRVREHRSLMRSERETAAHQSPSFNPAKLVWVLRHDRDYDRYMSAQMLLGTGNLMAMSLVAVVMRERFGTDYLLSLLITAVISMAMMPLSIPLWSALLDARHAASYRAIHSWFFVASLGAFIVAFAIEEYWMMVVFALVRGMAFGGGAIGWTLAHLDFAPPAQTSRYMGVHVTLTGLRGLIAWLAGVGLYEGFGLFGADAQVWTFVVCLAMAVGGSLMYMSLARDLARRGVTNPDGSRIETA